MTYEISVITTSLNYGRYIDDCIKSVQMQKFSSPFKINHLIMDGGSTDETLQVVKKHGKKVYFYEKKGETQTKALNSAMNKIDSQFPKTNYIGWVNADDYYNPCWLEASLSVLRKEPKNVAMTCGRFNQVNIPPELVETVRRMEAREDATPVVPYVNIHGMTHGNSVLQPTVLIRMSIFRKLKEKYGYWFNPTFDFTQDLELWGRILSNGFKIRRIPERVATLNRHPNRLSVTHRKSQRNEGHQCRMWLMNEIATKKNFRIAFVWHVESALTEGFWENKKDSHQNAMHELSINYNVRLFVSSLNIRKRGVRLGQDITFYKHGVLSELIRLLKTFKPNMIFLNTMHHGFWPYIIEEFPDTWKAYIDYGGKKVVVPQADEIDAVIMQQEYQKKLVIKNNDISPEKVYANPFCIDTEHFRPMPVHKLYTGIMVADFRKNIKRQQILIKAWQNIPGKLLLLGRFERSVPEGYHDTLMTYAEELGVRDRIIFMDGCPTEQIPTLISMAKIGYLTSHREAGSRALLEKMCCGLPVIVMSDCAGSISLIKPEIDGLIADPLVKGDIAAKTMKLLENYKEMGVAASERIRREYPYSRMSNFYRDLVKEVKERIS